MKITLQQIRDERPCGPGWRKLMGNLGNPADLSMQISVGDVLLSNGLDDALWCTRFLDPRDRVRLVMPAVKRAAEHTTDQRVHDCIAALDRWLNGDDTVDLVDAAYAAYDAAYAAYDAAYAAYDAAYAAARAAAYAVHAAACAADAAARAAADAADAAAESAAQRADILRLSPPLVLTQEAAK